jgi:hypothetical protein
MALRRALSALPDPASVDDHVVVVGVTVDPDGAEQEAVNLHCRPPGQSLLCSEVEGEAASALVVASGGVHREDVGR